MTTLTVPEAVLAYNAEELDNVLPKFKLAETSETLTLEQLFDSWGVQEVYKFENEIAPAQRYMVKMPDNHWSVVFTSTESNAVFLNENVKLLAPSGVRAYLNYVYIEQVNAENDEFYAQNKLHKIDDETDKIAKQDAVLNLALSMFV